MIRAVIFDMYETLITVFDVKPYYSMQMAADAGVPVERFREFWRPYEKSRTIGACGLETALRGTLTSLGVCSEGLVRSMLKKRLLDQTRIFSAVRPEILSMLETLKKRGFRIGLLSNCYEEERDRIVSCALRPYFDAMTLSCEQGICKPDPEIFRRALNALDVLPEEALYVGDGGSMELEAAARCGLKTVQACWFIREDRPEQPCGRKDAFPHAEEPAQIAEFAAAE